MTDEEEERWEEFLTPKTDIVSHAQADCNIWDTEVDEVLQFDRKGYYRCDRAANKEGEGAVFFKIPTGKE